MGELRGPLPGSLPILMLESPLTWLWSVMVLQGECIFQEVIPLTQEDQVAPNPMTSVIGSDQGTDP